MRIAIITGSAGLIGSEATHFFASKLDLVIGIDNNMREEFFGADASTLWNKKRLESDIKNYIHEDVDIRDRNSIEAIFRKYNSDIELIIHTAAQPSHDWAAKDPFMDFTVNANGTLVLLEMMREYCSSSVFIFTSTNKVYGDTPNKLPLIENDKRWEIDVKHQYYANGINEEMSIDQTRHSLFGASKVAADILVQEYGQYFNMNTGVFRGGCLTGPNHSGTQLHGFLSYLMKCTFTGEDYSVFGYGGKQVRDNIHSYDLVNMLWHFYQNPKKGEVYNVGGSRHSNCSMIEAIQICEDVSGNKLNWSYSDTNRIGDHIWWISDVSKFQNDYPEWKYKYDLNDIVEQLYWRLKEMH
jgi:CDP-paratose 2-epimerase